MFSTDDEVQSAVKQWAKEVVGYFFDESIRKLIPQLTKCIFEKFSTLKCIKFLKNRKSNIFMKNLQIHIYISNTIFWTWNERIYFYFISLCRISGNAASNKNIHGTVSEQLKKNFAKSRWKVRKKKYSTPNPGNFNLTLNIIYCLT